MDELFIKLEELKQIINEKLIEISSDIEKTFPAGIVKASYIKDLALERYFECSNKIETGINTIGKTLLDMKNYFNI